ncbi:MAG: cytochrome c4 [Azoarcus sp.]|jgi:cytochrome c553|nr:cytochrome c4 [Azoarcus sp.]
MIKRSLLLSLLVATSLQAQAQTPEEKARQHIDTVCVACHMADGNSQVPEQAKLAGQHADYLYKQMRDFKAMDGKPPVRENAIMNGMISVVPDEDLRAVANYLAAQTLQPATAKNIADIASGQKIWRAGIAAKGVPACAACHGPAGKGLPAQYPALAGQFPEYLEIQLKAFRDGVRANDPASMMRAIALRMTDPEIKAVADYAAGLR